METMLLGILGGMGFGLSLIFCQPLIKVIQRYFRRVAKVPYLEIEIEEVVSDFNEFRREAKIIQDSQARELDRLSKEVVRLENQKLNHE